MNDEEPINDSSLDRVLGSKASLAAPEKQLSEKKLFANYNNEGEKVNLDFSKASEPND